MPYSHSGQAWITQFYLQITPCLPFLCKRSPDGATPNWGSRHPIAAYYLFIDPEGMKGWVDLVGWPIADCLPTLVVTRQLQVERTTGKFAGQRLTLYRCATQPTYTHSLSSLSSSSFYLFRNSTRAWQRYKLWTGSCAVNEQVQLIIITYLLDKCTLQWDET